MKLAIVPINVGVGSPRRITAMAHKAEECGLESVWTFEHVIVPQDYASTYPYHSSGKMGVTPETPFMDPLVTLAHVAASMQEATTTWRRTAFVIWFGHVWGCHNVAGHYISLAG